MRYKSCKSTSARPGYAFTQDWLWSTYRGAIGLEPKFGFVNDQLIHGLFGGHPEKAIPAIRDFVEES